MYRIDGNIEQQLRDLRSRKNNNGIKEDIGFGISKRVENEPHKIDIPNIDEDASTFDISNERSKNVKQTTSKVDSIYSKNVGGETEKKFTAVGKHVTNGVVDGLFIKNKETGIVKYANSNIVKSAAKLHQIDNVGVRELNGEQYLFGIGMSIKDLPIFK